MMHGSMNVKSNFSDYIFFLSAFRVSFIIFSSTKKTLAFRINMVPEVTSFDEYPTTAY